MQTGQINIMISPNLPIISVVSSSNAHLFQDTLWLWDLPQWTILSHLKNLLQYFHLCKHEFIHSEDWELDNWAQYI